MPKSISKRKKPKRKRRVQDGKSTKGPEVESSGSGTMMGFRSGFKNVVGTGQQKKASPTGKIVNWVIMGAALILLIFFLFKMSTQ